MVQFRYIQSDILRSITTLIKLQFTDTNTQQNQIGYILSELIFSSKDWNVTNFSSNLSLTPSPRREKVKGEKKGERNEKGKEKESKTYSKYIFPAGVIGGAYSLNHLIKVVNAVGRFKSG